jgi:uroporphyrinogen-III decarboxylase
VDKAGAEIAQDGGQELYAERLQRIEDAIALRETDRAPFVYTTNFWAARIAGLTFQQAMYDLDSYTRATRAAVELLQPDAFAVMQFPSGQELEELDYKPMRWPGHGTDPNVTYQYLDQEFMSAAEYDEYLLDPTGFYLGAYLPRVAGAFKMFEKFPPFASNAGSSVIRIATAFADPEVQEGLKRLSEIGAGVLARQRKIGAFVEEMKASGFPIAHGAFAGAPYDMLVDFMRGSKEGVLDMFRRKDKLIEAMAKVRVFIMRDIREAALRAGSRQIYMPLHWGLDAFMSPKQFSTFYWPDLKRIILDLIEMDLVPCVFWEGVCDSRLEIIGDIPPGKAIYKFEATDLFRAKEVLGDVVCLRGNVPASLLTTGTPDDVTDYCRRLILEVGKGGGFILDGAAGIPDETSVENAMAMAKSVRTFSASG